MSGKSNEEIFGITLATKSVIKRAPLIIVYGVPKIGKSLDAAISFSDAMWLCHDPKVLRAYATWYHDIDKTTGKRLNMEQIVAQRLRDPEIEQWSDGGMARVVIPEFGENMKTRIPVLHYLYTFIQDNYVPRVMSGQWPVSALVIDETSDFVRRALYQIEHDPENFGKSGKLDGFEVNKQIVDFVMFLGQIANMTGKPVIMSCGEKAPSYQENKDKRNYGALKYKGGPDFMQGGLIRRICHCADVIVHRSVIEAVKEDAARDTNIDKAQQLETRVEYIITASETWERGVRDTRVQPRYGLSLREFLTECGFPLG